MCEHVGTCMEMHARVSKINGNTPLHLAANDHQIEIIRLLLKHGASIIITNRYGQIPYDCIKFVNMNNKYKDEYGKLLNPNYDIQKNNNKNELFTIDEHGKPKKVVVPKDDEEEEKWINYRNKIPTMEHKTTKKQIKNISSSIRGSIIGSFIGLVPHVGTAVGTNLSPNLIYIAVANIFRIHFGY